MKEKLSQLTDTIENLDFTKDNSEMISKIISDVVESGTMPFFYYTIPKETVVLRARRNENSEEPFWFPHDLSFRRDIYKIHEFQRATIAKHTSFYGTFGVSNKPVTESSMKVVMLEALPEKEKYEGVYTIGQWVFEEALNCFTVIDAYYGSCENPVLKSVYERYGQFLKDNPETKDELERFNKVLSNEFKKTVRISETEKNHLLYQVSGTVGTILQTYNFGVVYPTAKVSDYPHSLNVAIPWRFADSKLKINYAGMFRVKVDNNVVSLDGLKECKVTESVINNPNTKNNQDMLSGKQELRWKNIGGETYYPYF